MFEIKSKKEKAKKIIAYESVRKGTTLICPTIPKVSDGLKFTHRGVDLNELFCIQEININIATDEPSTMTLTCALEKPIKIEGGRLLITDEKIEIDGKEVEDINEVSIKYVTTGYPSICVNKSLVKYKGR